MPRRRYLDESRPSMDYVRAMVNNTDYNIDSDNYGRVNYGAITVPWNSTPTRRRTTTTKKKNNTKWVPKTKEQALRSLGETKEYIVGANDTLSKIDSKRWRDIAIANGISDPNKIQVGQKLIIPKNADGVSVKKTTSPTPSKILEKTSEKTPTITSEETNRSLLTRANDRISKFKQDYLNDVTSSTEHKGSIRINKADISETKPRRSPLFEGESPISKFVPKMTPEKDPVYGGLHRAKNAIEKFMSTPIMVQQTPGVATTYNTFGQYTPKTKSTYGAEINNLVNTLSAPFLINDLYKGSSWLLGKTPYGRSVASMSGNNAYRIMGADEFADLNATHVFRENPNPMPLSSRAGGLGEGARGAEELEDLGAISEFPRGEAVGELGEFGDFSNTAWGAKHFTQGQVYPRRGIGYYPNTTEQYVVAVPGRSTQWYRGPRGQGTILRDFNEYKPGDVLNIKFNDMGVAEGIGTRGAKAYKFTSKGRLREVKLDKPVDVFKGAVNGNGEVNPVAVERAFDDLYKQFPTSRNPRSIFNKGYGANGERIKTNLVDHTLAVAEQARTAPLPAGVSRQEFVKTAIYHDLGKIFNASRSHGRTSTWLTDQMGIHLTNPMREAIAEHMGIRQNSETLNNLLKALHTADVGRGLGYERTVSRWPYLQYRLGGAIPLR